MQGDCLDQSANLFSNDIFGDVVVDFFLRYQGPLPTCSRSDSRAREKDVIRRQLSPQLKDLWEHHPWLNTALRSAVETQKSIKGRGFSDTQLSKFGHALIRGWKFIPLVVRSRGWICQLHITFLRRHDPGDLVQGGDIDNRLKTLFDGLRIPYDKSEIATDRNDAQDELCFCLLEDDALITSLSIETERLYGPIGEQTKESDVDLTMRISIKKYARELGFI